MQQQNGLAMMWQIWMDVYVAVWMRARFEWLAEDKGSMNKAYAGKVLSGSGLNFCDQKLR
eukprot:4532498-Amphidinium_carterae.1